MLVIVNNNQMKAIRSYKVQRLIQAIHFSLMIAGGAVLIMNFPTELLGSDMQSLASIFFAFGFVQFYVFILVAIIVGLHIISSALSAFMHYKTSVAMAIASKVLLVLAMAGYMWLFSYGATGGIFELTWWAYWLYPALGLLVLFFPAKPSLRDMSLKK